MADIKAGYRQDMAKRATAHAILVACAVAPFIFIKLRISQQALYQ